MRAALAEGDVVIVGARDIEVARVVEDLLVAIAGETDAGASRSVSSVRRSSWSYVVCSVPVSLRAR
ncbi:hypothetical protein GCM10010207_80850 [Streptomyces atratus]|nr:hypothetical protein GCM10010207_80850 [Streptomyces atratus]